MHGDAHACDRTRLHTIQDLEKVIFAQHRAAGAVLLLKLHAQLVHRQSMVVDRARCLPVQLAQGLSRHDAEIREQHLAHVVIDRHGFPVVSVLDERTHQMLVKFLFVRLDLNGLPAQRGQLLRASAVFEDLDRARYRPGIQAVVIRLERHDPDLARQARQQIAAVAADRSLIRAQTRLRLLFPVSSAAPLLKLLDVERDRYLLIPHIPTRPAEEQPVSQSVLEPVEQCTDAVKDRLERVCGVRAARSAAPAEVDQLLLRKFAAAVDQQIREQRPYPVRAVVAV